MVIISDYFHYFMSHSCSNSLVFGIVGIMKRFFRFTKNGDFEEYQDQEYLRRLREYAEQARFEFNKKQLEDERRTAEEARKQDEQQRYWWYTADDHDYGYTSGFKNHFSQSQISSTEVYSLFRKLSKKWHPDTGGTTEAMKAINEFKDELIKMLE